MDVISNLQKKAAKKCPTIIFQEGKEEKIVKAAEILAKKGILKPVILGNEEEIKCFGVDMTAIKVITLDTYADKYEEWAKEYEPILDVPARMISKRLKKNPLWLGGALVHFGIADGMVAGFSYPTADVIFAFRVFVGLAGGVKIPSSYFLMDIPTFKGGEDGLLIYADGGVVPNPTAEELANIAETTADSVVSLLDWEPRVAMLSFSTKGSAKHKDVQKVVKAFELVKEHRPEMKIDGELQGDAALSKEVAAKKAGADNVLQGNANILIFPDLDAGNIAYKLTQKLTGGKAYGPLLQGFAKPVSDLSRGSSVEDIIGVATIVAAQV